MGEGSARGTPVIFSMRRARFAPDPGGPEITRFLPWHAERGTVWHETSIWKGTPVNDDPENSAMQDRADVHDRPDPFAMAGDVIGADLVVVNVGRYADALGAGHIDHLNLRGGREGTWESFPPGSAPLEPTLELSRGVARAIWSALQDHFAPEVPKGGPVTIREPKSPTEVEHLRFELQAERDRVDRLLDMLEEYHRSVFVVDR